MACLLVEHGAYVSEETFGGSTIFHYAVIRGHTQLLRFALDRITIPVVLDIKDSRDCIALCYATDMSGKVLQDRTLT